MNKICHCLMASGTKKWIIQDKDIDLIYRFNKRLLNPKELDGIKVRQFTPNEYEKIQGFPIGYTSGISDSQRYKQIGNSISINVLEDIFKNLIDEINYVKEKEILIKRSKKGGLKKIEIEKLKIPKKIKQLDPNIKNLNILEEKLKILYSN